MSETVKNGFGLCLLSYPTAEAVGNSAAFRSDPDGNLFVVGQRLTREFPTTLVVGLTARNSLQPLQRLPHQRPKPLKTVLGCAYCPTPRLKPWAILQLSAQIPTAISSSLD